MDNLRRKRFRALNSIEHIQYSKPWNSTLRGFLLGENMENIKQSKFFLAPDERAALLEAKYERARAQVEAMIAQIEAVKKIVAQTVKD